MTFQISNLLTLEILGVTLFKSPEAACGFKFENIYNKFSKNCNFLTDFFLLLKKLEKFNNDGIEESS